MTRDDDAMRRSPTAGGDVRGARGARGAMARRAAALVLALAAGCGADPGASTEGTGAAPTAPFGGMGVAGAPTAAGAGAAGAGTAGAMGPGSGGAAAGIAGAPDPGSEPAAGAMAAGMPATGAVPATFDTLKSVIQQAPCFGAGCHNDEQNPLDLRVNEELHARVTSRISESCGGIPVVSPGDPEGSALVRLLRGPCGETPRMPIGCVTDGDASCVPPDYMAAIEQWIAAGAPEL